MQRPLIGEMMSKVTDIDAIVEGVHDYYENQKALTYGKSLDAGRLFYYLLFQACRNRLEVTDFEVCWNHNASKLIGMIEVNGKATLVGIPESKLTATRERVAVMNDAIAKLFKLSEAN